MRKERSEPDRLLGIDIGRYVAFIAVVVLHTLTTTPIWDGPSVLGVTDHAARCAVPFFFIVSGFFAAGRTIDVWQAIRKIALRLLPVYLLWVAVYALLSSDPSSYFRGVGATLRTLANGGAGFHLWFLPSLGLGMSAVLLSRRYLGYKGVAAFSVILYATGLCLGSYRNAIGIPGDVSRAGPLFAFGFIALGFWFRDRRIGLSAKYAIALAATGLAIQIAEAAFLNANGFGPFSPHNFLLGTLPFGLGLFALCFHVQAKSSFGYAIAKLGQTSFGMYCVHVLFVWLFAWMIAPADTWQTIIVFAAVVACSTVTIYAGSFVRIFRPLIE